MVDEIIVVDDGSEQTSHQICEQLPVILHTHAKNLGKAQAILSGLNLSSNPIVMLVDADLLGLNGEIIDQMIVAYTANNIDLLLAQREKEMFVFNFLGISAAFTGERICKKELLLANPQLFTHHGNLHGYLLEPIMNRLFFRKYRVGKHSLRGVAPLHKIEKNGLSGFIKDLLMHAFYVRHVGLGEYLWQCRFVRNLRFIE